jgi:hypothetical protein
VVRQRDGLRVREYEYELTAPEPSAPPATRTSGTVHDLLADAARHFETPTTVRVNPEVWKEYDVGKVFRERIAVDGAPGRYREVDKQWYQWREYQNGHLVEQCTYTGRIWSTDAFGRWSTSGGAGTIPEYLSGALPRLGGEVGLPGSRGWTQVGREADFRGADMEIMGHLREWQDVWHGVFTRVEDGVSVEMPMWQRELRSQLLTFSTGFLTDFTANLAITAAVNGGDLKWEDVWKAMIFGGVGGAFNSGLNLLYNHTRLGWLKTSMGTRDWGGHINQTIHIQTDGWGTEFTAQEKVTRWRNATYTNTVGVATGALSAFVSNAISAAVFGVNGHDVKGADALLAGAWGAAGAAFGGVTTNLAKNAWHLAAGGRVFHKGGLGEYAMNWGESALSRYITYEIIEADKKNDNNLPHPGRPFPPQQEQQEPGSDPDDDPDDDPDEDPDDSFCQELELQ